MGGGAMGEIEYNDNHENIWLIIIALIEIAIIGFFLTSCTTTKYVPVESVRDVYHNTTDTIRDSIYHDIYVNQYIKGDTVYQVRTEYLYKDKWRNRTDTLIQRDTIRVPYPIEKQLTKWQQLKQDWFGAIICVLAAVLAALVIIITIVAKSRQRQNY